MYVIANVDHETLYNYVTRNCRDILVRYVKQQSDHPALDISTMIETMQHCDTPEEQLGELFRLIAERNLYKELAECFTELPLPLLAQPRPRTHVRQNTCSHSAVG